MEETLGENLKKTRRKGEIMPSRIIRDGILFSVPVSKLTPRGELFTGNCCLWLMISVDSMQALLIY